MTTEWKTEWPHPFSHDSVMRAHESQSEHPMNIHRALTIIDRDMWWLRTDIKRFTARDRQGYEELHRSDETVIYKIKDGKWEEITNALLNLDCYGWEVTGRIGIATHHVHHQYADRILVGDLRGESVLVLSTNRQNVNSDDSYL